MIEAWIGGPRPRKKRLTWHRHWYSRSPVDNARARGIVCGYATDETPEATPLTQRSASCLCTQLDTARRNGDLSWLTPAGYVRATVEHKKTSEGALVAEDVRSISVSDRHGTDVKTDQLDKDLRECVMKPVRPVRTFVFIMVLCSGWDLFWSKTPPGHLSGRIPSSVAGSNSSSVR